MQDLREIHIKAFMAIGPNRIAILALALAASQKHVPEKDTTLSLERLEIARDMFDNELDGMLASCDAQLSQAAREALVVTRQSLAPFFKFIGLEACQLVKELQAFENLYETCVNDVEPKVTAFLKILSSELFEADTERKTREKERGRNAVRGVEGVGRSIHLISFNAGVEAARLGDEGRGFTVIASEIRNLAKTTSSLLEEISEVLDA